MFMTVEQAKASVRKLEQICSIRPTSANLVQLSNCYFLLNDVKSALPLAERAFSLDPNNPTICVNLGLLLNDIGDFESAHKAFKVAYEIADEEEYVRLAYSESLLRHGWWKEAWPIYDSARQSKEAAALTIGISLGVKEWHKTTQPVDELIVIDEGGIGDRITFCRWLPLLTKWEYRWKYFPFPELRSFFERAPWCGPSRLVNVGDSFESVSHWTTIVSLPAIFGATPESVPDMPKDTFRPLQKFIMKYKLARTNLPTVGLCWHGDETRHGGRKVHSMTEGQAMRLVCKTDHLVNWVNLNNDHVLPEPVENPRVETWEELAGLISNLDAVFSVETGPMCLADALGKPLTVLLSSNSDWRFLKDGPSPFYPNARLIRNGQGGGIESAIDGAIGAIEFSYKRPKLHVAGG